MFNFIKKCECKNEIILRKLIQAIRSSLDFEKTLEIICDEIAKLFNVQRVAILDFGEKHDTPTSYIKKEFRLKPEIKALKDFDIYDDAIDYWVKRMLKTESYIAIDENEKFDAPDYCIKAFKEIGVKSALAAVIQRQETKWGAIVIFEYDKYRHWSDDEINLINTVADQIYIAINQAKAYERVKETAKRELLLRKSINKIRSSLNVDEMLDYICEKTAKTFNVQRTSVSQFLDDQEPYQIVFRKGYNADKNILAVFDVKNYKEIEDWGYSLFKNIDFLSIDNIQESALPDIIKINLTEIGLKSIMAKAIKKGGDTWGILVLSEYNVYRHWTKEEKKLLRAIADQVYISINQAELYTKQKNAAKREKINRNIIEILRSSLDKQIIKRLFVKNIGKLFTANRVNFLEYDDKLQMYLPVDKNSEYLSSSNEKSFIGYDWTNPYIIEYTQLLLEKREIIIKNWDEYIKQNPDTSEGFISLYEDADIKSSYNFPVLHQNDIIGNFCIDFTQNVCELSDEDINLIRCICTQAGIALYQARLYQESQEIIKSKNEFISKTILGAKNILNNIIDLSDAMSATEAKCEDHIKHLNHVRENVDLLLELINNLVDGSDISTNDSSD